MKIVIANFKSNKNKAEIQDWISSYSKLQPNISSTVVLCPPFPHLLAFEVLCTERTVLGVQDISSYPAGAYTGAVGVHNLDGFSVQYAIIGHSERRRYFHENTQDIASKVRESLSASIKPIVCVTKDQINDTANALSEEERRQIIVAFEPIEHIGTGTSDTLDNILETKKWVQQAFGNVPYIYGGSANPKTDPAILHSEDIDGFLVGSACLDPKIFSDLLQLTEI
jgi:triosephosphate isomerase